MKTHINRATYQKLIDEDIERLKRDMGQCPERDHIKAILNWSVDKMYHNVKKIITKGSDILTVDRIDKEEKCSHNGPRFNPQPGHVVCGDCYERLE